MIYRIRCRIRHRIRYRMRYLMRYRMQGGLVPPLHPEQTSGIISRSEQILKEYASKALLTAKDIIALIQDVLHNPEFNADDVDTDMLKRFARRTSTPTGKFLWRFQTVQLLIPGTTAGQGAAFLRSTSGCGITGGRSPERSQWRMQR